MSNAFSNCSSLQSVPPFDFAETAEIVGLFNGCRCLKAAPQINAPAANWLNTFGSCGKVELIGDIDAQNITGFVTSPSMFNTFSSCTALKAVKIKNLGIDINLSDSTLLTHDCLVYIIDHAQTVTGKTMTFGATNLAKLTDAEKQVAIDKGWTLA